MIDKKELKKLTQEINILYAEDHEETSKTMIYYLNKFFKSVDFAPNGEEALKLYKENSYDLIITDIQMPIVDGLNMSSKIKKINSEQNIIITSAYTEVDKLVESIKIGIDGYILKPIDYNNLNEVIYKTVTKIKKFKEHALYEDNLELLVNKKNEENINLELEKINNYKQTLYGLIDLIEKRDIYTGEHSLRVATYSKMIAEKMGYSKSECEDIYIAGILHDIGKIVIPDSLLLKPSKFTTNDHKLIQEHVNIGFNMLNQIDMFKNVAKIIKGHHERVDGSGYPNYLKDDEILIESNILAVADSFDAMTSYRVYKDSISSAEAIKELQEYSGIRYKKEIVDVASVVFKDISLDENTNPPPTTNIEQERFSYFYNDKMTGLFNESYLDYILVINLIKKNYEEINFITIDNLQEINMKNGWLKGNEFLIGFSKYLKEIVDFRLIFRVYGNHFIVITEKDETFDTSHIKSLNEYTSKYDERINVNLKKIDIIKNNVDSATSLEKYL